MKNISRTFVALASVLLSGANLYADNFEFTDGDLILGFQASSGTGITKNVFVNLGAGTAVRDNPNPGSLGNIGATLTATFGANWYDRGDIYFGVIGNLSGDANEGFGSSPAVNGDPSRTFYLSTPAESPKVGTLIAPNTYPGASLGSAATILSGMEEMLVSLTAEGNGSAVLDATTQPVEWNNGWSILNPTSGSAAFTIFSGGIQQSFGKGGTATYVDIQRVLSTNTGAVPAGVIGGGTYVTTISISSNGNIKAFSPAPEIVVQQPAGTNLTDGSTSATDFGNVNLGDSSAPVVFTVKNTGSANLTGLSISKNGENPGNFTVGELGATSLAPDESTTFEVVFTPNKVGSRTAAIHIASNDADEDPFDIELGGTGVGLPEIAVEQPAGTDLVDGTASIGCGSIPLGESSDPVVFTVKNLGTADLTGLSITKNGSHGADFAVGDLGATTLAPNESTTFAVTFTPGAAGARTAAIHIASNDADEDPFDIDLTGANALIPEIAVENPSGGNLSDGSASFSCGSVNRGSTSQVFVFTVKNNGTADLTGLAITKDGSHSADFTVGSLGTTTLAPNESATFNVSFKPGWSGARSAAIHIASNDANENPFDISLTGTGVAVPEIGVQQPVGTNVYDNGWKTFGSVVVGSSASLTFTLKNTGSASLTGLGISVDGTNSADFTVTAAPVAPVAAAGSTTFIVRFKPTTTGTKSATLRIANNDPDEDPFDIRLDGKATAPEIGVQQPVGTNIWDNGSKSFGAVVVGSSNSLTFTIKNTGNANLTGLGISVDGTNSADFTVTADPVAPVAIAGSTTFTVRFKPTTTGTKSATLRIANNDPDEDPFDIRLNGKATAPEIGVQQPVGTNLSDNGSKAFGSVAVGSSNSLTFTIKNTGSANLTGLGITIDGSNAANFTVTADPLAPVAAAGSTTFTVRFKPTSTGSKSATLHISSNDANEDPFDIRLNGKGVAASPAIAKSASSLPELGSVAPQDPVTLEVTTHKEVIGGKKYRVLVVAKTPGTDLRPRMIEVSPNLIDWFSGSNHTTTLQNDASFLKVRDNTPLAPGTKRYIRLNPPQN